MMLKLVVHISPQIPRGKTMGTEDIKTLITAISVLIAAASLSFNVYQYKSKTPTMRREDVRTSLASIIQKIDSSEIFTVQPHQELWLYGFKSLEEARSVFSTANIVVSNSKIAPSDIKLTVQQLLSHVRSVIKYRDSLTRITGTRDYAMPSDLDKWAQKQDAEAALHDLQRFVSSRDMRLREYLESVSG